MNNLIDMANAFWRLDKWVASVDTEKKMAAKSALRSIKKFLAENDIEIVDLTGSSFDSGLSLTVVNNESDITEESNLVISEMIKPIVMENGAVIQFGQVILREPQDTKNTMYDNKAFSDEPAENTIQSENDKARHILSRKTLEILLSASTAINASILIVSTIRALKKKR